MKTVVYIHSYPGATDLLAMLWPGFKRLGWPIIGVETVDGSCVWPELIPTIKAGQNAYWTSDRYNLTSRLVLTLEHFLTTGFERCCVLEYDTLILGPLPEYPPGFIANLAGGRLPNAETDHFFHTPWIFDRETAAKAAEWGISLMLDGTAGRGCHGSPDVFLGLIVDRAGLKFTDSGTFSRNSLDRAEDIAAAQEAKRKDCVLFHGVKTRQQMEAITGA